VLIRRREEQGLRFEDLSYNNERYNDDYFLGSGALQSGGYKCEERANLKSGRDGVVLQKERV
jgi:hypothetical protein